MSVRALAVPAAITNRQIASVLSALEKASAAWENPWVEVEADRNRDPFRVLVSCLLSLRTQDRTTAGACRRLFGLADTPCAISHLSVNVIEKAIYPVGFYRNKARTIKALADDIITLHEGQVPDTMEGLLSLKGVGRKTANLVLSAGFGKPGICVDTHVHRITNRWGYVDTSTPLETEMALRAKLPPRHWTAINKLLVMFGQNCCKPVSPLCSKCVISRYCPRRGVTRSR